MFFCIIFEILQHLFLNLNINHYFNKILNCNMYWYKLCYLYIMSTKTNCIDYKLITNIKKVEISECFLILLNFRLCFFLTAFRRSVNDYTLILPALFNKKYIISFFFFRVFSEAKLKSPKMRLSKSVLSPIYTFFSSLKECRKLSEVEP